MTSALANFLSLIYYSPLYNSSYMWIFPYNRLLKYAIQSVCSLFLPLASCSFPHSHIHAHLHTLYSHTRILCNNNWPDIEWHVSRDGWSLEGNSLIKSYLFLFFKDFIYLFIFRERGKEREREGETSMCGYVSHAHPTGDLARNPGMGPDWESNWRPFGWQSRAQSTEPHQPRQKLFFLFNVFLL